MTDRHSFTVSMRLFAVFLLLAIGLQAVPSGDLPLARDHGSAFGAASFESAVARQTDTATTEVVPRALRSFDTVENRFSVVPTNVWRWADPAAPSPWAIASPLYRPRPPPLA